MRNEAPAILVISTPDRPRRPRSWSYKIAAGRWPKRIARSEFSPSSALVVDEWIPIRH